MNNIYSIVHVNCNCGAYNAAYLKRSLGNGRFIKCKHCGKKLGDLEIDFLGEVTDKGDIAAMKQWKIFKQLKKELQTEGDRLKSMSDEELFDELRFVVNQARNTILYNRKLAQSVGKECVRRKWWTPKRLEHWINI
jgi:hypothetical protein